MGKSVQLKTKPQWQLVIKCIYIVLVLLVSGCATHHKAPVVDKTKIHQSPVVLQGMHTVKTGETLYSIAEHSGRDYHELAALNELTPPYRVVPGQVIHLSAAGSRLRESKESNVVSHLGPAALPSRGTKLESRLSQHAQWIWPAKGSVIRGFNPKGTPKSNGIDIAGREGDGIFAAASGKVVYSGNGLRAYGKLVILKHNNNYLSAYGQNRKLLVKEGDMVKVGQKIAEMGRSSTGYAMLHFEIRKAGKPVDPREYLAVS